MSSIRLAQRQPRAVTLPIDLLKMDGGVVFTVPLADPQSLADLQSYGLSDLYTLSP
jgi:hypothetical protein